MAATVVYARSRSRIAYVEEWRVLDLFGGCLNSATPSCCQASVPPAKLGSARGHPSPDDAIRPPRARSPDQRHVKKRAYLRDGRSAGDIYGYDTGLETGNRRPRPRRWPRHLTSKNRDSSCYGHYAEGC